MLRVPHVAPRQVIRTVGRSWLYAVKKPICPFAPYTGYPEAVSSLLEIVGHCFGLQMAMRLTSAHLISPPPLPWAASPGPSRCRIPGSSFACASGRAAAAPAFALAGGLGVTGGTLKLSAIRFNEGLQLFRLRQRHQIARDKQAVFHAGGGKFHFRLAPVAAKDNAHRRIVPRRWDAVLEIVQVEIHLAGITVLEGTHLPVKE